MTTTVYVRHRGGDDTLAVTTIDSDGKAMSGPTMLSNGDSGGFQVAAGDELRVVCMAAQVADEAEIDATTYTEGDDDGEVIGLHDDLATEGGGPVKGSA